MLVGRVHMNFGTSIPSKVSVLYELVRGFEISRLTWSSLVADSSPESLTSDSFLAQNVPSNYIRLVN